MRWCLFFVVALVACHRREHEGRAEHDKHQESDDEALYAVPVPGCTCATQQGSVVAIHAPREGKVLWHFGVSHGKSTDEISVFTGHGQKVMAPGQDARLFMACDSDLVAVLRLDRAAAWRLGNAAADAQVVWAASLPAPVDVTGVDAPSIEGSDARAGCGHPLDVKDGAFRVRLRDGKTIAIAMRDGTLTPSP